MTFRLSNYRQDSSVDFSCFTFTGKERDAETGYGYFGARYMDHELMTGWLSVDPLADKYPGISPYAYCAWNPVKLVDPDGREIILTSIFNQNGTAKKGCETFCSIFNFFAKTKLGQKYLGKYAKAGQTIAGHTYKKDGEYHKKGIDLNVEYGRSSFNPDNRGGYTNDKIIGNGEERYLLNIHINPMTVPSSDGSGGQLGLLETLCHEFFIHAEQSASHYSVNRRPLRSSNTDQELYDIFTNHKMRDCALPIMNSFCNNRELSIKQVNQSKIWKNHPSWSQK